MLIVDPLEIVEVEQGERAGGCNHGFELFDKSPPVAEPSQQIGRRHSLQFVEPFCGGAARVGNRFQQFARKIRATHRYRLVVFSFAQGAQGPCRFLDRSKQAPYAQDRNRAPENGGEQECEEDPPMPLAPNRLEREKGNEGNVHRTKTQGEHSRRIMARKEERGGLVKTHWEFPLRPSTPLKPYIATGS